MWKPIYAPEPWPQYLKRKDNIGLPLMEVKSKYLTEQLQFDNFQSQQLAVLQGANSGPLSKVAEQGGNVAPSFADNVYMKLVVTGKSTITNQIAFEIIDTEGFLINGKPYYQSITRTTGGEGTELINTDYYIRWDGTDHWELFTTVNSAGVISSNTDITGDVPYPSTWTITGAHGIQDNDNIIELRETSWFA